MRPYLIVNPQSGGGRTGKVFAEMRRTIEQKLGPCEVVFTERTGHGVELAQAAVRSRQTLLVVVGGDGTLNEVVNGVMLEASHGAVSSAPQVALIGQGTGGDFRKTLAIEHRLDSYLAAICSGKTRLLDVGHATFEGHDGKTAERHFVNILSAGMGGLVDQYVATASRAFGGAVAYFGASARALANVRLGHLRCVATLAGKTETHNFRSFMVAICNGRYFGGGMHIAPMADATDGIFDIVAFKHTSKVALALQSRRVYNAAHLGDSYHFRADRLELELTNADAREMFLLDVDGEPAGRPKLVVEMLKNAIVFRG
jgi:diacylglycerol kinase (ATP)